MVGIDAPNIHTHNISTAGKPTSKVLPTSDKILEKSRQHGGNIKKSNGWKGFCSLHAFTSSFSQRPGGILCLGLRLEKKCSDLVLLAVRPREISDWIGKLR